MEEVNHGSEQWASYEVAREFAASSQTPYVGMVGCT